jgi:hypothetical protein
MQRLTFGRSCVLLVALVALACSLNAQVVKRPISDFIAAQGQTSIFMPPAPDLLGWLEGLCVSGGLKCLTPPYDGLCVGNFAWVDYAGVADRFIVENGGISSGTETDGLVLERPLPGGRVEVTVSLRAKNALAFVVGPTKLIPGAKCAEFADIDYAGGPLLLGARANTLPPPSQRALGHSFFHIVFKNDAGSPLPDIIDLFNNRYSDIEVFSFHAVASGPMPGGARGTVTVLQNSNIVRSNLQPAIINLRQTGP